MRRGTLAFILFLILGATIPYAVHRDVGEDYISAFNVQDFYGSGPSCDRAMLLETEHEAWEERIRLMSQAQSRIIVSTFDFRSDESGLDMLAVLLDAAEKGIDVKIIIDGMSGLTQMAGNSAFYALSAHSGVEIKLFNEINLLAPWKSQARMHDKYVIVDELAYILGGRNMNDLFLGEYESSYKNYDREALIYNTLGASDAGESSLRKLEAYFDSVWTHKASRYFHDSESLLNRRSVREQTELLAARCDALRESRPELFEPFDYSVSTVETGGVSLLTNPVSTGTKEPLMFYSLTELMKSAEKSVVIHSPYAVCNGYMYDELRMLSESVGDVRLVLNSLENAHNFFTASDYTRHKPTLLETGISIFEYDGGAYHCKSILIDDRLSVIGSFNLDMRSVYIDTELMLVIDSEALAAELRGYMDDIESLARQAVDIDTYIEPAGHRTSDLSAFKRTAMTIAGCLIAPIRFLL